MTTNSLLRREGDFSANDLSHIIPGCFVKIQIGKYYCWVEIKNIIDSRFIATIAEVEGEKFGETTSLAQGEQVTFEKNEIIETGCDRWCFC